MTALSPNHWAAREFSVYVNVVLSHSYKEETGDLGKQTIKLYFLIVSFITNTNHQCIVRRILFILGCEVGAELDSVW